jgi:ketosteroid isomerase-like protein
MSEADPLPPPPAGGLVLSRPVERMDHAWNEALSRDDAAALTAPYAPDAAIESPFIPHPMGKGRASAAVRRKAGPFWEH